jgi:hypothetical protein
MNAVDVLKYGNRTLMQTVGGLPHPAEPGAQEVWEAGGVCGFWSVKNIISHLASYELVLVDVLTGCLDGGPTPNLDKYLHGGMGWNDHQVELRSRMTPAEALAEYDAAYARVSELIPRIAPETLRQPGTLPWYGAEYALDDYLAYAFYGHKREHSAQIAVYLDRLAGK